MANFFLTDNMQKENTVDDMMVRLHSMTEQEVLKQFYRNLLQYNAVVKSTEEMEELDNEAISIMTILQYLMQMDLPIEERWKIQDILVNRDNHLERLNAILQETVCLVMRYEKKLQQIVREYYNYWEEKLQGENLPNRLCELVGMQLIDDTYGWVLEPCILNPKFFSMEASIGDDNKALKPTICRLGVLFGNTFTLEKAFVSVATWNEDDFLKALKLLSDKSKLDLLQMVKDTPAYGNEIAKHLGLKTATVSYHTSALIEAGLLSIDKVENKVYYRANKDAVKKVLEYWMERLE